MTGHNIEFLTVGIIQIKSRDEFFTSMAKNLQSIDPMLEQNPDKCCQTICNIFEGIISPSTIRKALPIEFKNKIKLENRLNHKKVKKITSTR